MTPGDIIVFAAYIKNLCSRIEKVSEVIVEFTEALVSGERILELVAFDNVVFGYRPDKPGAERAQLHRPSGTDCGPGRSHCATRRS